MDESKERPLAEVLNDLWKDSLLKQKLAVKETETWKAESREMEGKRSNGSLKTAARRIPDVENEQPAKELEPISAEQFFLWMDRAVNYLIGAGESLDRPGITCKAGNMSRLLRRFKVELARTADTP
jgi:hypothetical protein